MAEAGANTAEEGVNMVAKAEEEVGSMVAKADPNITPATRAVGSTVVVAVGVVGGRVREGTVSGPDFLFFLGGLFVQWFWGGGRGGATSHST